MKKSYFLIVVSLLTVISCKKDNKPYSGEFEKSYQQWNNYKSSIKNSYSYINYTGSIFGFFSETTITVRDGKVTARSYTQYKSNGPIAQLVVGWTEDQSNLNSHTQGAESLTIDEVYTKAKNEWLSVDKKKNDIFFEIDNNGLMISCGYVPIGCLDDCFNGVHIKSLMAL